PKPEYGNESRVRIVYRQRGAEVAQELRPDMVKDQMAQILSNARAANPAARMIVKMDKDASYGVMADLMPALQAAKASRCNVQTALAGKSGLFGKKPGK